MNNTSVDSWLADGCGRCENYQTPQCKVHLWTGALVELRRALRATGLVETMKWGNPCYTLDGKNVVMLTAFKDRCALSFFKGVLLDDDAGVLDLPGPATHAGRLLAFTSVEQVREQRELVDRLVAQAVAIERAGRQVERPTTREPMPDELQEVLDADPAVAEAFAALTPGRQRSYVLHVSGAKQGRTRASRAERAIPKILSGKGFNER